MKRLVTHYGTAALAVEIRAGAGKCRQRDDLWTKITGTGILPCASHLPAGLRIRPSCGRRKSRAGDCSDRGGFTSARSIRAILDLRQVAPAAPANTTGCTRNSTGCRSNTPCPPSVSRAAEGTDTPLRLERIRLRRRPRSKPRESPGSRSANSVRVTTWQPCTQQGGPSWGKTERERVLGRTEKCGGAYSRKLVTQKTSNTCNTPVLTGRKPEKCVTAYIDMIYRDHAQRQDHHNLVTEEIRQFSSYSFAWSEPCEDAERFTSAVRYRPARYGMTEFYADRSTLTQPVPRATGWLLTPEELRELSVHRLLG